MEKAKQFEDLVVWKEARKLVMLIYSLSRRENLIRDFGLCDQLRRAAVSIMTNIAEGFERKGQKEKVHFYKIARASAGELRSLLYVASDVYPEYAVDASHLHEQTKCTGRMLTNLIRSFDS